MKLLLFLSHNGSLSRRKAFESIRNGEVRVNGDVVAEPSCEIDPAKDKIEFRRAEIRSRKCDYILLNKPAGYVTTCEGQFDQRTVMQLLPRELQHVKPVGRLDKETEGLLLLTNDGELANKLMHPKNEIYKTYFVKLSKPLEEKHRIKLTHGIKLGAKKTAPCKIRFAKKNNYEELYISIYEGRNRQVRNMFEHYGYFVRELERVAYAGLKLDGLKDGQWRQLNQNEISKIKK